VIKVAAIRKDADEARRKLHYESLLVECSGLLNHSSAASEWQKKVDELSASAAHVNSTVVDEIVEELADLRRAATPVDPASHPANGSMLPSKSERGKAITGRKTPGDHRLFSSTWI